MIVIDPGHGGSDPGGGTNPLFKEKDMNLQISKYQFNRFEELGIPVKMTRYVDRSLSPKERSAILNSAFGQSDRIVALSNHINRSDAKAEGAIFIHSIDDSDELSNTLSKNLFSEGQKTLAIYTRKNKAGKDYYFIIRNTRPIQTIIVEYAFGDNVKDRNKIFYNWPNYAEGVVRGAAEHLNLPYLPPKYIPYIVKKQDSLYQIAKQTNSSVNEIMEINNLTTSELSPDQQILVPYVEADYNLYVVQPRDNLYNIAKTFGTTTKEIIDLNNLKATELEVGQVLKIPK